MPETHQSSMPDFSTPQFPSGLQDEPGPDWQMGRWCQFILLRYMQDLLAQREVVWRNERIEGVHQIRVSARRLRTALQTFGALWQPEQVKFHSRYLARFADAFGTARDLDVMIVYLESQLHGAHRDRRAALEWMLERKRCQRLEVQPALEDALLRFEADNYAQAFISLFSSAPTDFSGGGGRA